MTRRSRRVDEVTFFQVGERRVWHYRFQVDGARRSRTTRETDWQKAQVIGLDAYRAARLRARGEEPEPTVGQLVEEWVRQHTLGWSPAHVVNMERFGRLHLGPLAVLRLSEVSTEAVENARNLFLQTHAKTTANLWRCYLRLAFRWAVERRMIRSIPWKIGELKTKRKPKPRLPSLKTGEWLGEVDALVEREPSIGLAIRLMVAMGLRCSEAREARWEWLSFEAREYTPGDTKGGEAQARPVPDWVLADLAPLAKVCGPMIPTQEGKLVTAGRIQRVMDAACRATGIPRMTPHKLRHTYATWLSEEGVPIQDIQVVLGHKDKDTTWGYLGVDLSRVRRAQARLATRLQVSRLESGEPEPAEPQGA